MQKIQIQHTSDADQRIDRFLKKYLPNAPLGAIYKLLRTGKIKVNGKKKDQTYKLLFGDEIDIWLKDEEIVLFQKVDTEPLRVSLHEKQTKLTILYEDEFLMVVSKPPGLNVHPWDHKTKEVSLIEMVQDALGKKYDSLTFRPALVHRIDRDTSGCVLIAKEKKTLEALLSQLQSHEIEKIYHALVFGTPKTPSWTIREKLLRIEDAKNEAKVRVDPTGQSAVTHYRLLTTTSLVSEIQISSLECRIETGRTHQIRVHLSHIGMPLIWDKLYGDKKKNAYLIREKWLSHQMLHAKRLTFVHPVTKKSITVDAPYPSDWLLAK